MIRTPAAAPERELFPPPSPRRRLALVLLGAALVALVIGGLAAVWVERQLNPPGGPGAVVTVKIPEGTSGAGIARVLHQQGIIGNENFFRVYMRVKGAPSVRAGIYTLRRHDHLSAVVSALAGGGKSEDQRVVVPEGFTVAQIAQRVGSLPGKSGNQFLTIERSGTVRSAYLPAGATDLEGLLYPDTYQFRPKDDEREILTRMVTNFDSVADGLGFRDAAAHVGVTPYQAIVIASLVEREAKVDEDRGPIARVIYNRLAHGMPLQIDATVEYALGVHKDRLTNKDLELASPYNTYRVKGLPPTPIASPGRKSLMAALDPPPGPWLYYVLIDPNGKHAFATTPQEFEKLKAEAHAKGLV